MIFRHAIRTLALVVSLVPQQTFSMGNQTYKESKDPRAILQEKAAQLYKAYLRTKAKNTLAHESFTKQQEAARENNLLSPVTDISSLVTNDCQKPLLNNTPEDNELDWALAGKCPHCGKKSNKFHSQSPIEPWYEKHKNKCSAYQNFILKSQNSLNLPPMNDRPHILEISSQGEHDLTLL